MFNFPLCMSRWAAHPKSIARATPEDVAAGRLAPACDALALAPDSSESGREREAQHVQFVCLDAPTLQEGELLPVGAGIGCTQHGGKCALKGACCASCNPPEVPHAACMHPCAARLWSRGFCNAVVCRWPKLDPATLALPAQVDELLEERGVRLCGNGAVDAVTIRHPGLTLFPLDDESMDAAGPQLQVMAALMLQEEDDEEDEESGSDGEPAAETTS